MATDKIVNAISDYTYLARSKKLVSPSDDTYYLIQIPKNAFVEAVWLSVITAAVAGTPSFTVGWAGNGETAVTNGFITNEVANVFTTGLKRAQSDSKTTFEGKYFSTASGVITATYAYGNATTKGVYQVFVKYTIIS